MNIIRHIKVDLYGDVKRFAVSAKQMDMGTRYIGVALMQNGIEYKIPEDSEVVATIKRPDGSIIWNDAMNSNNEALVELTREILLVHGTAKCDIELYQSGNLLSSATFEIEIFPSQRIDRNITSSGEYTRLENSIFAAREALQAAQDTSNEIVAAERLRVEAENLRELSEEGRKEAIEKCLVDTQEAAEKCLAATQKADDATQALEMILEQTTPQEIIYAVQQLDAEKMLWNFEHSSNVTIFGNDGSITEEGEAGKRVTVIQGNCIIETLTNESNVLIKTISFEIDGSIRTEVEIK